MLNMNQLIEVNRNIKQLQDKRQDIVKSMESEIITIITNKMDWQNNTCSWNISYGTLEHRIMVDVRLKEDPNARYVFSIGKSGVPHLEFREVFKW